jgi:hypothetical protein
LEYSGYMTGNEIREALDELDYEVILFDGLDDALVGWVEPINSPPLAVYDYVKLVELVTVSAGSSWEDGQEYVNFNIVGAYVGPGTPLILYRPDEPDIF